VCAGIAVDGTDFRKLLSLGLSDIEDIDGAKAPGRCRFLGSLLGWRIDSVPDDWGDDQDAFFAFLNEPSQ
jgi:hypothetical protein